MKLISWKTCAIGLAALAGFFTAAPASAQATRTWVSGVGDDVNPCSRTAPCKTFAGAISKTAAGGEINCLDPGGFGTLTITKSITIDCTGTFGSALNTGTNGFVINDGGTSTPRTADVRLRGLSINGGGSTPGLNGIRLISGRSLVVEDVFIQNQKNGAGISIAPSAGTVKVTLKHVTVTHGAIGVDIRPTGSGTVNARLIDVTSVHNSAQGMRIDSTLTAGNDINVMIDNSAFDNNLSGIVTNSTTQRIAVMLNASSASKNVTTGIDNFGGSSTFFVGDTSIIGNSTGVASGGGGSLLTFGDNRNQANPNMAAPNNGSFTGTAAKQ